MSDDPTMGHIGWSPDFKSGNDLRPGTPGLTPDQFKRLLDDKMVEFVPLNADVARLAKELAPVEPDIVTGGDLVSEEDDIIRLLPGPNGLGVEVAFTYVNWKGEMAERRAVFTGLTWGKNEWHPTPQLLIDGYDLDKQAPRTFAAKDISNLRRL